MGAYAIRTRLCSPNTLFSFRTFSKEQLPEECKLVNFGVMFWSNCDTCVKKGASKNVSKKGGPPNSNDYLFAGQEAPGEAASRAHFPDKKQLFEQQLKHCSKFLQKKSGLGSKLVQKTDRIAELN